MATYATDRIRQGLPRTPGGAPWPDVAGAVIAAPVATSVDALRVDAEPAAAPVAAAQTPAIATESVPDVAVPQSEAVEAPAAVSGVRLRQGLPRIAGGEPWPPGGALVAAPAVAAAAVAAQTPDISKPVAEVDAPAATEASAAARHASPAVSGAAAGVPGAPVLETVTEEVTLRQGLPRVAGGDPWPPAGTVQVQRAVAIVAEAVTPAEAVESAPAVVAAEPATAPARPTPAHAAETPKVVAPAPTATATATPAPTPAATPTPSTPVAAKAAPKREPRVIRGRTIGQWAKLAILWGGGAIVAAGIIVLAARGVTTLPGVPEFMKRYPGEYHLPEFVDPGFPAWARWTHFLNFFLMILIIRSGLLVRQQQKPDAFFTPKKGGKKISIYLWFHTSIDVLWFVNGIVFVVLLFASGHWARIVPTSLEVFPNALSAMLQYLTLEWPVEDGWVNYNSLQQIMYFTIVFIAAPLAAISGVRMSEWWPKNADKLNKFYPAPVARAIHFPTMLFFVLFILIHVFLVFTTGALKNLNHMFAGTPEISWVGFWWFAAAVLVVSAVTWAARPLVLAPIAGLFGRVSER